MVICLYLDEAQHQSQNDPAQSNPLGSGGQSLIQIALAALAQVGILIATGQSTGQTGFLTGLQNDHRDLHDAGDHFQNRQDDLNNFHCFYLPPLSPQA